MSFSRVSLILLLDPFDMNSANPSHLDLQATARHIMQENGFEPDFPPQVSQQLADLKQHAQTSVDGKVRDLRNLLWSSIDNDTSRDLDQIEVAEAATNGDVKVTTSSGALTSNRIFYVQP